LPAARKLPLYWSFFPCVVYVLQIFKPMGIKTLGDLSNPADRKKASKNLDTARLQQDGATLLNK
jgi:hypothetical protein